MYIYVCVYIYILFICYIYFSLVLFLTNTIDYNRFCFLIKLVITIESGTVGLPWWFSGKESTCQCRSHWFDLWSGKMPRAVERLSSCITTIELALQIHGASTTDGREPQIQGSATREATTVRRPLTATRDQPLLSATR